MSQFLEFLRYTFMESLFAIFSFKALLIGSYCLNGKTASSGSNLPIPRVNKGKNLRHIHELITVNIHIPKGGITLCNLLHRTCLIGLNHDCNTRTSIGLNFQTVVPSPKE